MITTQEIETFRAIVEAANKAHYAELDAKIPGYFVGVTVEMGRKNAKFVIETGGQRSVLLFVELATGNIFKAAGWSQPAKGIRGNIAISNPEAGTRWLYR